MMNFVQLCAPVGQYFQYSAILAIYSFKNGQNLHVFTKKGSMVGNHFDAWVIGALMTSFLVSLLPAWDVAGRVQTRQQWNHLTPNYGKFKGLQTWEIWTIYFQVMGIQFCVRERASLPEVAGRERWISQLLRIQVLLPLGKARGGACGRLRTEFTESNLFLSFPSQLWLQKDGHVCQIVVEDVDETTLLREAKKKKEKKKPETPLPQVGQ